jgi:hypothetical protein
MRIPRNITYVSAEEMPWFDERVKLTFEKPIIDLKVTKGEFSEFKNVDFTYNMTKWDTEDMQIQIFWKKS